MTVQQLIDVLKDYRPDAVVYVPSDEIQGRTVEVKRVEYFATKVQPPFVEIHGL